MRDELSLYLVLWLILLSESIWWLPRYALVTRRWGLSRHSFASDSIGNANGGAAYTGFFPLAYSSFVSFQLPFLISEEGIISSSEQLWTRIKDTRTKKWGIHWADVKDIKVSEKQIRVNGKHSITCVDAMHAQQLAQLLEGIWKAKKNKRSKLIEQLYENRMDVEAAREALSVFNEQVAGLRYYLSILFLHLFVTAPVAYYLNPTGEVLLYGLLAGLVLAYIGTFLFYRIHKRLLPDYKDARRKALLKQFFCFPITIACLKDIAFGVFARFDPLVAAKVVMPEKAFKALAATLWRDLKYPSELVGDATLKELYPAAHEQKLSAIQAALGKLSLSVEELESTEALQGNGYVSYCPRCHTGYLKQRKDCPQCPGVKVQPMKP